MCFCSWRLYEAVVRLFAGLESSQFKALECDYAKTVNENGEFLSFLQ